MTGVETGRRRMHQLLKRSLLAVQSSNAYSRMAQRLHLHVEIAPATERDLTLVRCLRVQSPSHGRKTGHLVAKIRGVPCGYMWTGTDPPHERPYAGLWISQLRVHPLFRRFHVAQGLVQRAADDGRKHGYRTMLALVYDEDPVVLRLYTKLGFKRVPAPEGEPDPLADRPFSAWSLDLCRSGPPP